MIEMIATAAASSSRIGQPVRRRLSSYIPSYDCWADCNDLIRLSHSPVVADSPPGGALVPPVVEVSSVLSVGFAAPVVSAAPSSPPVVFAAASGVPVVLVLGAPAS